MRIMISVLLFSFVLAACGQGATPTSSAGGTSPTASTSAAESNAAPAEGEQKAILLSNSATDEEGMNRMLRELKPRIEAATEGRYTIDVYNNMLLGADREQQESVQLGTIDMCMTTQGTTATFVPEMDVFSLPFLFDNDDHAIRFINNERVLSILDEKFQKSGMKLLGFSVQSARVVTNSARPINSLADLASLRVRVMENAVQLGTWAALGADPVPMAWSDVYTSLQQKALDGQENGISVAKDYTLYEVQKYISITNHNYSVIVYMMNLNYWNAIAPEDQKILADEFNWAQSRLSDLYRGDQLAALDFLTTEGGMEVQYPDISELQAAVADYKAGVVAGMNDEMKELVQLVDDLR